MCHTWKGESLKDRQNSLLMLNVLQILSPNCKWIIKQEHGTQQPRSKTQTGSQTFGLSEQSCWYRGRLLSNQTGAVNHVPGLNRLPKKYRKQTTPSQVMTNDKECLNSCFFRDRKLGSNFLLDTVMALVLFLEKNKMGQKTSLFTLQAANKTKFETFEQKSSTLDQGFRWWFPWVFTGACLELVCWYPTERNFEFHETQQKSHHFSKFDTNSSSNNGETPRNTLRIFNPNRTESSVFRN